MKESSLLFKIELLGVSPPVWRRFFVPPDLVLGHFHEAIQIVMGWDNGHLYEFTIGKERFMPEPDDDDTLDAWEYQLHQVVKRKGQAMGYLYDFGDSWEHKLKLENLKYSPPVGDGRIIGCLDGGRACPPEDVGGVWGYEEFLKALAKPHLKKNKELVEWYEADEPFDSERFDLAKVNDRLAKEFSRVP
ncbi:MAG: plasmid pRiA4b ORF-3 family protein [Planctomycetota bacterium]|jgi:hypothetical protein|nr:plasmid pRiA4b ORF-3 family protein [Planctomycetota bacterium]